MADVSIKYKNNIIAEMSESGTKTLNTKGCYCEDNVEITYSKTSSGGNSASNCKRYDLTLAKSSGWILLTTLDEEILEHINDIGFVVTLCETSGYVYEWYSGSMYIASNNPWGMSGSYPTYGLSTIESSETTAQTYPIFYPPNSTNTDVAIGGKGKFRVDGNKYYFKPGDGFIKAGTYRLIFSW